MESIVNQNENCMELFCNKEIGSENNELFQSSPNLLLMYILEMPALRELPFNIKVFSGVLLSNNPHKNV